MSVDLEAATRLYEETTALTKKVFFQAQEGHPLKYEETAQLVWHLVEHMTLGDRGLVYFTNRATPQNFLIAQSVNVCILSLLVGSDLGYDTTELNVLGIGALLHDIGMVRCRKTAEEPRKLTPGELEEIRRHPIYGAEILKGSGGFSDAVISICREHRRRKWDREPASSEEEKMRQYAQIVGLVDIYVAMTQPRPYRDAKLAHEAVRELIGGSFEIFDTRIIKTLVNQIGIYPIGSWVRLNTREVARVVEQNRNFPLHPVVEILFDAKGKFLEDPPRHDLYKKQTLYIKEPVDYQKFKLSETGE